MSESNMTHWIEIADERHFFEDAMLSQMEDAHHLLHLGETIVKIASWVHRRVNPAPMPETMH
jgi:hypothetical protein